MSKVGIVGYCCDTGLGLDTREFYEQLPFAGWLVIEHHILGVDRVHLDERCHIGNPSMDSEEVEQWLAGIDTVFAFERGYIPDLWSRAKARNVRTILCPNAEWFQPHDPQMNSVDLFLAPTRACAEMLEENGFGARTHYIPHVLDTDLFAFRRRERAEVFTHYRGLGGYGGRKGTHIVLEAARQCPEVQFVVRYQWPLQAEWPRNVRLIGPVPRREEQYVEADVAIQPSLWEGVGLQILEAMSCGLPTIVPDAAPMNEYPVSERLCVPAAARPVLLGEKTWTAWEMDVSSLVRLIRQLHEQPIQDLSEMGRAKMEQRSWTKLRPAYCQVLGMNETPAGS
ncbi:MAG: glycosyltransferase [Acidobacteria bacterium]|nr:glycosyltransferase [Acidobacteriota bacterium]